MLLIRFTYLIKKNYKWYKKKTVITKTTKIVGSSEIQYTFCRIRKSYYCHKSLKTNRHDLFTIATFTICIP